jgi:hypothetical protein
MMKILFARVEGASNIIAGLSPMLTKALARAAGGVGGVGVVDERALPFAG